MCRIQDIWFVLIYTRYAWVWIGRIEIMNTHEPTEPKRLSLRSQYSYFKWRIFTFTGRKCHVIIVIKTDLSGFVVTMHWSFCEQCAKSIRLTPCGFDFLFRTHPRTLWQNPSKTGFNPLSWLRVTIISLTHGSSTVSTYNHVPVLSR